MLGSPRSGGSLMSRQNAKTCILLAAVLIVVSSATWFRKEVQTVYRNLEKPGGGVNSGVAVQGSGNKPADHKPATSVVPQEPVKPVEPPVKPGELLQNPEQKDTLRALVLELLVRFNRNLVTIGGTKIAGEGTWPVCFDKPYWRKDGAKYLYMDGSNNEMEGGRCAQYTFGVDWDFSFDDAFHNLTGCDSHSFDPSMEMNSTARSDHKWYWNLGISDCAAEIQGKGMRSGKVATWKVDTVEGHMRNLQHDRLALLKIDVEGFEWIVLREALSSGVLEHVDQLLFEVHLWTPGGSEADRIEAIKKWHAIFAELEEVGFKLFYVHTNPLSSKVDFQIGFQLPCCFEVGYFKPKRSL